jgi:hypothetical protein
MKTTMIIILMAFMASSLYSQRIPDNWDINLPSDTSTTVFARGVSDPKDTERGAILQAEDTAIISLAQKIYLKVDSSHIGVIKKEGSEINEFSLQINDITTKIYLSGVSRQLKIKRDGNKYIAFSLVYIDREEAERARMRAENELTSYHAYHFFKNKIPGLKPFDVTENPEGGYHAWVISNTGILSVRGNDALELGRLEQLVKNIFPRAVLYAGYYDRVPVRIIYAPSGLDRLTDVLKFLDIGFISERQQLIVYDIRGSEKLMLLNPLILYLTGIENIHDRRIGDQGIFARELTYLMQNNKKSVVFFPLPSGSYSSGKEILDYIIKSKSPSCRYVIIYFLETFIEPEIRAFRIPPHLFASSQILVYDLINEEIIFSENQKNGIPVNGDLAGSYELLMRRLLNPSIIEKIFSSMEARNEL